MFLDCIFSSVACATTEGLGLPLSISTESVTHVRSASMGFAVFPGEDTGVNPNAQARMNACIFII